jgi:hypothetical protein
LLVLIRVELEELQLLEKTNRRRAERLEHVGGKNFQQKERVMALGIAEERRALGERLSELVVVRQKLISDLYHRVFPMEVLPLSNADAGAEGEES